MQRAVKFGLAEPAPKVRTVFSTGKPADIKAASKLEKKAIKLGLSLPEENEDKKKARAERFGMGSSNNDDEAEKLRKRQERFGNIYSSVDSGRVIRRVKEI